MVGKAGALVIRFVGDTRAFNKSMGTVSKRTSGLSKIGKGVALGVGAAIGALGAVAVQTTKDLMRVERLGAQTEAAIKATGGAAGRTRSQVDALAGKLEAMSGAEAETVTEGQNMLLTFKNIKGKQFDEATKAMLDMGVAMNKGSLQGLDLKSTSIQMGKALNDPIKGITALSKVGVSFTDQQKEQIKAMVKAGDTAGAQKVILNELKGEFGGAAKAAGQTTEGMMAKVQNTFGNIAESILRGVLPMLEKVGEWVTTKVLPALSRFGDWLRGDGKELLQKFGGWLKDNVLPPLKKFGDWLRGDGVKLLKEFGGWLKDNVLPALQTLGGFIKDSVVPAVQTMGEWVWKNKDAFVALGIAVGTFFTIMSAVKAIQAVIVLFQALRAVTIAQRIEQIKANIAAYANPYVLLAVAIVALVVALVIFFTKTKMGKKIWKGFTDFLTAVVDNVAKFFKKAWKWILGAIQSVWKWIKKNWPLLLSILLGPVGAAVVLIIKNWKRISGAFRAVWEFIRDKVFGKIKLGLLVLREVFRLARDKIGEFFGGIFTRIRSVWTNIRDRIFGAIRGFLGKGGKLRNAFSDAVDAVGRIWAGLKRMARAPVRFLIETVWNSGLREMLNAIPGVNIDPVPVPFAQGGAVRGGVPGRDSVRALMMPGEHVWTAKEVAAAGGHKQMVAMRKAVLNGDLNGDPRFAAGGSLSAEDITRGQKFARSQVGKPYGWGAVGPSAYDCSGFMSAITNVLQNLYPHTRRGATNSFPWPGFQPGPGEFTIGSTPSYGGGVGHMAGTLGGLNVESRGGVGVIVGARALGASSPGFTEMAHLGRAGKAAMNEGGAGWFETIQDVLDKIKKLPAQIADMMAKGGWIVGFLKKLARGLWSNLAGFINDKIPNWGPIPDNPIPTKFARGGIVRARPGGVHGLIGEGGHDEAVIPLSGPYAPPRGRTVIELRSSGSRVDDMLLALLRDAIKVRGGDVQLVLGRR